MSTSSAAPMGNLSHSELESGILAIIAERDAALAQVGSLGAENAALRAREKEVLRQTQELAAMLSSRADDDKRFVELLREVDSLKAEKASSEREGRERAAAWESESATLKQALAAATDKVSTLERNAGSLTASNKALKARVEELSIQYDEGVIALQAVTEERDRAKADHAALTDKYGRLLELARKHIQSQAAQPHQQEAARPAPAMPASAGAAGQGAIATQRRAVVSGPAPQVPSFDVGGDSHAPSYGGRANAGSGATNRGSRY